MILRMAGPSLMSRDRHVPSRGLFVAGTITSYAPTKQQEEIRCPPRSRETLVLAQEFAK
jgi:hypothetical protein